MIDPTLLLDLRVILLLSVFGVASYFDWKVREVRDELWLVGGVLGGVLLLLESLPWSLTVLELDALLLLFVIQHFIPWDARMERWPLAVPVLEGSLYVGMILAAIWAYLYADPQPPVGFFAGVAAVVIARALFESGVLYGGADAKALMVAGIMLPVIPQPWFPNLPATLQNPWLAEIPFAFTMLVDGALISLAVPLAIVAYNLSKGEHRFPHMFHMYVIPTEELPRRYVWLKDPAPEPHPREETTEEDNELRAGQARELLEKGVKEVWVTPQIPFLIPLALGAIVGLFFGDVLLWLIASLP